jgi:hypothetical protein
MTLIAYLLKAMVSYFFEMRRPLSKRKIKMYIKASQTVSLLALIFICG